MTVRRPLVGKGRLDFHMHRALAPAEGYASVEDTEGLLAQQSLGNAVSREGPREAQADEAGFDALFTGYVNGVLRCAAHAGNGNQNDVGVVEAVFFNRAAVRPAEGGGEFRVYLFQYG